MDRASTEVVIRAWFAAVNAQDPDAIAATLSDDFTWALWDASTRGREASREAWRLIFDAIPDYHMRITGMTIDGAKAAVECTIDGTQTGPLRFRGTASMDKPFPATGRAFHIEHSLALLETREGRIVSNRAYWQPSSMLQQLGHV